MQTQATETATQAKDSQAAFARNLVETLGVDEAIDVCARNCWAGIGAVIESEQLRRAHLSGAGSWFC